MTTQYSRRNFIKKTALWTAAGTLPVAGSAGAMGTDPVLVSVFLRGGADALNIVVPHGDGQYGNLRPGIQLSEGAVGDPDTYTDLDGFFGLNNSFSSLRPMFENRELGFIHCAGSTDETRSHFEAQDYMDAATPGRRSTPDGWLQRALTQLNPDTSHAGISMGKQINKAFAGGTTPTNTVANRRSLVNQRKNIAPIRTTLENMYKDSAANPVTGPVVTSAFQSLDELIDNVSLGDTTYPAENPLGRIFREVAALIKADIGVRIIAVNIGGWDHHTSQSGRMAERGNKLSGALEAFRADLGDEFQRTLVLGMTEFGRTNKENGNGGTDHGHGSLMFGMGGRLVGAGGGKVLLANNDWIDLKLDPDEERDRYLAVTTDFRDVFAEVLDRHMNLSGRLGEILPGPGYISDPGNYPGLI